MKRLLFALLAFAGIGLAVFVGPAAPAAAAPPSVAVVHPMAPPAPPVPGTDNSVSVNVGGTTTKPSNSIVIILAMTVLSVAPALLLLCTSFTKVFVVLSITRNAGATWSPTPGSRRTVSSTPASKPLPGATGCGLRTPRASG